MSIKFTINGFIDSNDDLSVGKDFITLPTGKQVKIVPAFFMDEELTKYVGKLQISHDIKIEESNYHGEGWDS